MDGMDTEVADALADDDDDLDEDGFRAHRSFTKELWFLGAVALVLALVLKTFFVQAFFIPSGSMEQTLHGCPGCQGDRVLVNKLVYKFRDIHRGEIVVFNGKGTDFVSEAEFQPPKNLIEKVRREFAGLIGFGGPGDKDFIKRVIGIPGDVVACCTDGKVTVNGQPIDEPYVYLSDSTDLVPFDPVTVPRGQLFLMGDHRDGSSDSRAHGPVPQSKVVGRAFAVFYPLGRRKILRVPATFDPTKRADAQGPLPGGGAAPPVLALAFAVPVTVVRRRVRRRTD